MAMVTALPSFSYEVTTSLLTGARLPDGDEIVLKESGTAGPGSIAFRLEVPNKGMWWKGLVMFDKDKDNVWKEVVAGDGKELPKRAEVPAEELKTHYLVLSKAKMLGAHSNVYNITDAALALERGKEYTIIWNKD